jgi:hypothetical protein
MFCCIVCVCGKFGIDDVSKAGVFPVVSVMVVECHLCAELIFRYIALGLVSCDIRHV